MNQYLIYIVIAVAVTAYLIFIYRKEGTKGVLTKIREAAYQAMLTAEKKFGPNAGEDKFVFAMQAIYDYIAPDIVKKFYTDEDLEKFMQELYDKYYWIAKDYLDDGEINKSIE